MGTDEYHQMPTGTDKYISKRHQLPPVHQRKDERKELQRMLSDCKKGKFEKVIVWELSRLGRSLGHLVNTLQEMSDCGVDLYSVREGIDTSTQMGKTMFGLIGVFSEFELQVRKDRVQRGIDHYRKNHRYWGRRKSYDDQFKNNVIKLREQGLSLRKISSELFHVTMF